MKDLNIRKTSFLGSPKLKYVRLEIKSRVNDIINTMNLNWLDEAELKQDIETVMYTVPYDCYRSMISSRRTAENLIKLTQTIKSFE